ncbi:recombinase family protein [Curtobacterium sp. MCBD17_019]|uniref:recombinase family protein n=1 Tax=Curtobacterium sp. MCBD17_019 TaxID=2175669 RepID=UPI000DA78B28|nr:recombinase family protein [Curtobacterium sp. MCBD17_019]PZE71624.1 hypothetical protein DEI82_15160 [Curtobacterium sp. MCBD17_019]
MKVIGYARLSRATEESTSIARQRQAIQDTARQRGWELVRIETDNDVSATRTRLDRPGLNAVRDAIAAGDADAVLVWKLDRIARSVVDFGLLLDDGLQIVSCMEPLDTTTPMGRAMAEILQVFAAMEARTIGQRVSSSRKHLATIGRFPGGQPPYGYRSVPMPGGTGRTLEVDPDEAAIVRKAVDAVLGGESMYAVLKELDEAGVRTRRGLSWTLTTFPRVLCSEAMLGRARFQGKTVRDDNGLPLTPFPPILTLEEHDQLVARFAPDAEHAERTRAGRRKASRLLSGLLYCESCNSRLVVRTNNHPSRPPVYFCPSRGTGVVCTARVSGLASKLEELVTDTFLDLYGSAPFTVEHTSVQERSDVALVEAAIRDTTDELREPDADVMALVDRLNSLRAERERLDKLPTAPVVERVPTGETVAQVWHRSDYRAQRDLLIRAGFYGVLRPAKRRGYWDDDRFDIQWDVDDVLSLDPNDVEAQSRGPITV